MSLFKAFKKALLTMNAVELLHDLVSIYSPSTHENEVVKFLVQWMQAHHFEAFQDEVGNAVGIMGDPNAENTLMLLGHIDTVDGEIDVRIEGDLLYGRGSVDAKGSLCTFAAATAQATLPENWRVIVVGAVEEEISSSKGAYFIRDQYQPDLCIIGEPSSAERITLGYKGRFLVDLTVTQPRVHTSRDEPSVGELAIRYWQQIKAKFDAYNAPLKSSFDKVFVRLQSMHTASDGFDEQAHMTIGFRLPPAYPPTRINQTLHEEIFVDETLSITCYGSIPAYRGEKNNPLVRGMLRAIRHQQHRPAFVVKMGTSDMNTVGEVWNCPIIAYGPGDSNLDHTPHEHLSLNEYQLAINTLTHFIEHLDASQVDSALPNNENK